MSSTTLGRSRHRLPSSTSALPLSCSRPRIPSSMPPTSPN
jgi:hypothetical protein